MDRTTAAKLVWIYTRMVADLKTKGKPGLALLPAAESLLERAKADLARIEGEAAR